jgi:transposase
LQLRDWLASFAVTLVGMEATGVYWKPVYYMLEDDFELWLLNARHLKNVPGRKTDVKDAEWICRLVEHGLVRPSFVPPKEIRELRNLTRYRKAQIEERTDRGSICCGALQGDLPCGALRSPQRSAWSQESCCGGRALDSGDLLPHPATRRTLPGA